MLVARAPRGEVKVYPPAWNHHENQILEWSVIPAPISDGMEARGARLAEEIADTFQTGGNTGGRDVCDTKSGELLVNELAPRPHNSYHASERACVTSQFEQLVRAVCDLPLGRRGCGAACGDCESTGGSMAGSGWFCEGTAIRSALQCLV